MKDESIFPAYYMYVGEGLGRGDILYCKNNTGGVLIYAGDSELESEVGKHFGLTDWSNMEKVDEKDLKRFGILPYEKVNANTIQQERESDYGNAKESFSSIANFWSNYLSRKTQLEVNIDTIDVALMMNLFKISRNAYKRKYDNFIDGESYANFGTKLFEENYETIP